MPVLEDAAQAAGLRSALAARPGALGDARDVQLLPLEEPRCFGDGGAITTDDDALAEARARRCAFTARTTRRPTTLIGYNSRLRRAAGGDPAGRCCPHLDTLVRGRRAAAEHLRRRPGSASRSAAEPTEGARPAWHLYVVRHERPDELAISARRARRSRRAATTARRSIASRPTAWRRQPSSPHRRTRPSAPRDPDEPRSLAAPPLEAVVGAAVGRCASGSTSPTRPRARSAAGHRRAARRRPTRCEVTARDFAQTPRSARRFEIAHTADRPPSRRAAGGEGASASCRARGRSCAGLGAGSSTSRSATAPTT